MTVSQYSGPISKDESERIAKPPTDPWDNWVEEPSPPPDDSEIAHTGRIVSFLPYLVILLVFAAGMGAGIAWAGLR